MLESAPTLPQTVARCIGVPVSEGVTPAQCSEAVKPWHPTCCTALDTVPDPTPKRSRRRRCPECGSAVKRVLRSANDKRRWDADDWRRYRCRSDDCNWQGLLQVSSSRTPPTTDAAQGSSMALRMGRAVLLMAMAGGLAWAALNGLQFMMSTP